MNKSYKFTEKRRFAWMLFRKRNSIKLEPASICFNGGTYHLLAVRNVQEEPAPFPVSIFRVTQLQIDVASDHKVFTFRLIAKAARATELQRTIIETARTAMTQFVDKLAAQVTAIETAKSETYAELSYVRHSRGQRLAEAYLKSAESIRSRLATCAAWDLLDVNQKERVAALGVRMDALFPYLKDWPETRKVHNEKFVLHFAQHEQFYFRKVESSPLTKEQVDAALTFDDATVVVAAAGSGKSSCIVGKIGFALKAGLFRDDQILALAFNKDAARQLQERLNGKLAPVLGRRVNVASKTFHGFGLSILLQHYGADYEPRVLKEEGKEEGRFLKTAIDGLLTNDPAFQTALTEWMLTAAYEDPRPLGSTEDLKDCERRYEECCRERIWAKNNASRKSYEPTIPTFSDKVYVRSLQERSIANWLLMHGIPFEYEAADWEAGKRLGLPARTPTSRRPPYTPDFTYRVTRTLPDGSPGSVRIVHEHFALDSNGNAPEWMGGKRYVEQAKGKRKMYKEWVSEASRTTGERIHFFETHSADLYDGSLFHKLRTSLESQGITIGSPSPEIAARALASFRESNEHERLLTDFVARFKESGLTKDEVTQAGTISENPHRARLFLRVAFRLFDEYQRALHGISATPDRIDYADMLRDAQRLLAEKKVKVPYRFILVDEFQDISALRANLVKAVLDQAPEDSIVFCVGDDWQTINRFAGSDVSIFTGADAYFHRHVEFLKLNKTFRCTQGIADVSRELVMHNEKQFDKDVKSHYPLISDTVRIVEHGVTAAERRQALIRELDRIAQTGKEIICAGAAAVQGEMPAENEIPSVQILRRTQTDSSAPEGLDDDFLDDLKRRYKKRLTILVMSVHGSKGLEADFVIIPGLDSGFRGFPDDRPAEWLLDLVLPRITDPVEEERRLLYVGLTRARYQSTVLVAAERPSQFALELAANADTSPAIEWIRHDSQRAPCPRCQIGSLVLPGARTSKRVCTRRNSCGFRERP